jgi:nicotinate-nucleotide adenylyltransferase
MKIGLYFGSFNPIHTGHCIIASYMAQETDLDRVWIMVSPQNPFKTQSTLLNEYQRLHLAKLATEEQSRVKVSDIEFYLPKPSYTIDTLTYLQEKYPEHEFAIVMGSDGLQNIQKWKNAAVLLARCPIYVYPRPGFDVIVPEGASVTVVKAPLLDISATHIRYMIEQGKSVRYLVPDRVLEELERGHYYR